MGAIHPYCCVTTRYDFLFNYEVLYVLSQVDYTIHNTLKVIMRSTIDSEYFQNIDTPIKAYLLGFILGDGCLSGTNRRYPFLTITLNKKDRVILEKLKEETKYSGKIYELSRDQVRIVICHKSITEGLIKHGVEPRKSLTMPNILPLVQEEFRTPLILGLFDADGSCLVRDATYFNTARQKIYTNRKQAVQIRVTEAMAYAIIEHLGIKTYHVSTKDAIANLTISSKSEFTKFFNSVYTSCDFYLERKYEKFLPIVREDQTISSSEETLSELGARVENIA